MKIQISTWTTTFLMVVALAIGGCDTTEPEVEGCSGAQGTFSMIDLDVQDATDPDRVPDFAQGTTMQLTLSGSSFTSVFDPASGEPLTVEGTFSTDDATITLGTEAIIPGGADIAQSFVCEVDGGGLSLTAAAYDFDPDGAGDLTQAQVEIDFEKVD